jgi:predicted transcriptional regulator
MAISIKLGEKTEKELKRLAYKMSLEQDKKITFSQLIREAIKKQYNIN